MKKLIRYSLFLLAAVIFAVQGCQSVNEPDDTNNPAKPGAVRSDSVVISGKVLDEISRLPVKDAVIRIIDSTYESNVLTDQNGAFTTTVKVAGSRELTIIALKAGYASDTARVFAVANTKLTLPTLAIAAQGTVDINSGNPASISVAQMSSQKIGVKESGSPESTDIVFEVQDSSGRAIDIAHQVTVSFTIGARPGGGEFISPMSAKTDDLGRVKLHVTSGTKAGIVQIVAQVVLGGRVISSKPVAVAIHGGLPDQAHFAIAPKQLNIPGYNSLGVTDIITAYAGDKYSNPAVEGTAVYFTTTGGIIEGSALLSSSGIGSVTLMSAFPQPVHPTLGAGFATITATTADENSNTVTDNTIVLFSGEPVLNITPTSFDIPNGGAQLFQCTLSDQNGNPLASGTSLAIAVGGDGVGIDGDVAVNLPDTQSRDWTKFSFMVYDTKDTVDMPKPATIKITTSGPNGGAKLNIVGTVR